MQVFQLYDWNQNGLLVSFVTMQGQEKLMGDKTPRYREATGLLLGLLFLFFSLR